MGFWNINIQGCGAHHNKEYPKDANKMAETFVADLRAAGHDIEHATFTYGSVETISKPESKPEAAATVKGTTPGDQAGA